MVHEPLIEQLSKATPSGGGYVRISNKLQLRLLEVLKQQQPDVERRTTSAKAVQKKQTTKRK